jgi:hypothetical protein
VVRTRWCTDQIGYIIQADLNCHHLLTSLTKRLIP